MKLKHYQIKTIKFIYLFKHLLYALVFVFVVELLKNYLNIVEPDDNKLKDEFMSNFIFSFFGAICLSPIIEELVFRLPLIKGDYFIISLVLSFIFLTTSSFVFVKIILSLYVGLFVFYQFYSHSNILRWILIVTSILAFVIIHFDNFNTKDFEGYGLINTIILFLPQFFLAILITKIRMETTFINAVVFHSFYNFTILLFALFFNI
jgi:hypothetical protein